MWYAQFVPSGWYRFNRSFKTRVGNCPLCPPIFYTPAVLLLIICYWKTNYRHHDINSNSKPQPKLQEHRKSVGKVGNCPPRFWKIKGVGNPLTFFSGFLFAVGPPKFKVLSTRLYFHSTATNMYRVSHSEMRDCKWLWGV